MFFKKGRKIKTDDEAINIPTVSNENIMKLSKFYKEFLNRFHKIFKEIL